MTTLDIIYNILYCYGSIAVIWGVCILFMACLAQGRTHVPIKAFIWSTILWPYTMYLSVRITLFKIKSAGENE